MPKQHADTKAATKKANKQCRVKHAIATISLSTNVVVTLAGHKHTVQAYNSGAMVRRRTGQITGPICGAGV